jgi:hypothetical protein
MGLKSAGLALKEDQILASVCLKFSPMGLRSRLCFQGEDRNAACLLQFCSKNNKKTAWILLEIDSVCLDLEFELQKDGLRSISSDDFAEGSTNGMGCKTWERECGVCESLRFA